MHVFLSLALSPFDCHTTTLIHISRRLDKLSPHLSELIEVRLHSDDIYL